MEHTKFFVRCRAVIVHEGKLLTVKHDKSLPYAVLPGGHLEPGESIEACLKREIFEELGIEPEVGRLIYVHKFIKRGTEQETIEFIFEVTNGKDFFEAKSFSGTHNFEIGETIWVSREDSIQILPEKFGKDFKNDNLPKSEPRFING